MFFFQQVYKVIFEFGAIWGGLYQPSSFSTAREHFGLSLIAEITEWQLQIRLKKYTVLANVKKK